MSSTEGRRCWSVFDSVKFLPATPDALMTEINAAIAALEYTHATALINPLPFSTPVAKCSDQVYDSQIAEEAYRLGCAALSEGKVDEGLHSLNVSLAKCPPDQISAVSKIQSLISHITQRLQY